MIEASTATRLLALAVVLCAALGVTACTGRAGQDLEISNHSTYPHHYHDKNGVPHPKVGGPPPPPHNHHHGATWR